MSILLMLTLFNCAAGLGGSSATKGAAPNPGNKGSSSHSDLLINGDALEITEDMKERELEGRLAIGYEGVDITSKLLLNLEHGQLDAFLSIVRENPPLYSAAYRSYNNFNRYTSGSNNLLHIVVNTENINNAEFLKGLRALNSIKFSLHAAQLNSELLSPGDIALQRKDYDSLEVLADNIGRDNVNKELVIRDLQDMVVSGNLKALKTIGKIYNRNSSPELVDGVVIKDVSAIFSSKDSDSRDPIYYAVKEGREEVVDFLLDQVVALDVNYGSLVYGWREFILDVLDKSKFDKEAKERIGGLIKSKQKLRAYKSR